MKFLKLKSKKIKKGIDEILTSPIRKFLTIQIFLFLLFTTALATGGYFYISSQIKNIHKDARNNLVTITELKVKQISNWLVERRRITNIIYYFPSFQEISQKILENSSISTSTKETQSLVNWLKLWSKEYGGIRNFILFSAEGEAKLSTADSENIVSKVSVSSFHNENFKRSIKEKRIIFEDFHFSDLFSGKQNPSKIIAGFWIPVYVNDQAIGSWFMEIDPSFSFYKLVQSWPTTSATAEALLVRKEVRREGNYVVFLNELRHQTNTALNLRSSVTPNSTLPAAQAVLGTGGTFEGRDYRNIEVLSELRKIPDTPWYIVTKIDKTEVYQSVKQRIIVASIIFVTIVFSAGLGLFLVWSRQDKKWLFQRLSTEKRYRLMFNTMEEGVSFCKLIFDEKGLPVNFLYLDANPSSEKHMGISNEKVIGKLVTEVFNLNEAPYLDVYSKVALTGEPCFFETYFAPLQRNYSVSAFSPEKGFFTILFQDITEQVNARKNLEEEKERLHVTLQSIGDGVITTDEKGNITLMNKVAEDLTGWMTAEAHGRALPEVFCISNEVTKKECENPVEKVLQTGQIVELANNTVLRSRNGTVYAIADSGAPIRDKDNFIIGVVLVFRDVTEKQRVDERLRNNQRLESLGVLAGGIAHDFNNILSGLFGYIDLTKEALEEAPPSSSFALLNINNALKVFDRAKSLAAQLLTFSKGGKPITKVQSLIPVIKDSAQLMSGGSNVKISFCLPDNLWSCEIDEHQIGQMIGNLVLNAIQAMPNGGTIDIWAENISSSAFLSPSKRYKGHIPSELALGNYVYIAIRDSGVGIEKKYLSRIFDPFFTTKQKGSGLGLATSYSIIASHDGIIEVQSELGRGTTFFIYLPSVMSTLSDTTDTTSIFSTTHAHAILSRNKYKVLVMDDEKDILEICSIRLSSLGCEVECALDGESALEIFQKAVASSNPFNLVILDLTVPGGKGGEQILPELRKTYSSFIAVASSGHADNGIMSDPEYYGFNASLQKPYHKSELTQLLHQFRGSVPSS